MNSTINYAMFIDLLQDDPINDTEQYPTSTEQVQSDDKSPTQSATTTSETSRSRT